MPFSCPQWINFCHRSSGELLSRFALRSLHQCTLLMLCQCRLPVILTRNAKISSGQLAFFAGGMKLDLELTRSTGELKALFQNLQDPRDIAAVARSRASRFSLLDLPYQRKEQIYLVQNCKEKRDASRHRCTHHER